VTVEYARLFAMRLVVAAKGNGVMKELRRLEREISE
jgi:hypothetical protein